MIFRRTYGSVLMPSDEGRSDTPPSSSINEIIHLVIVFVLFMAGLTFLVVSVL